jgi:hypothetical protein
MSSGDFVFFHKFPPLYPAPRLSGRISGTVLRLLYILSHRQAENFFTLKDSQWKSLTTSRHVLLLQPGQRHSEIGCDSLGCGVTNM